MKLLKKMKLLKNNIYFLLIEILLLLSFLILSLIVGHGPFKVDQIINLFGQSIDSNIVITNVFLVIAWIGDTFGVIIITVIIVIYLLRKKIYSKIVLLTSALLLTVGSSTSVKFLVDRSRPENMIIDYHGASFPSGHATIAILFYGLILFLLIPEIKSNNMKKGLIFSIIVMGILIIFSRIYLSVHWFSDLIGGIILGLFWLVLTIKIYLIYTKNK